MADTIDDGFRGADIPDDWKVALALTDHMLTRAEPVTEELARQLDGQFDAEEQTELGLGIALFHGFSKMLIALGYEPDEMDTTIVPTPEPLGRNPAPEPPTADPHRRLLEARPELADRWVAMVQTLWTTLGPHAAAAEAARARLAQLFGVSWAADADGQLERDPLANAAIEMAELFAMDVRAITQEHRRRLADQTDAGTLVQLVMVLAIYDGIYRLAAARPLAG